MTQTNTNENVSSSEQSAGHPKKQTKKFLIAAIAFIVVIIIVAVVLLKSSTDEQYYTLSGYRYDIVYTTHTPLGNSTITNHESSDTWTLQYNLGSQFYIDQPFYNNVAGGTTTVSNITCETPGFNFISSSLPFPFTVPTALNSSVNNNNVIVRLTFTAPLEPYTGPLIYTVYFDYYPLE